MTLDVASVRSQRQTLQVPGMTIVSVLSFEMVGISHRSVVELDTPAPSHMTSCWAQVCDVKVSPTATIVFNDVKSELCLHMVFQSMFLT